MALPAYLTLALQPQLLHARRRRGRRDGGNVACAALERHAASAATPQHPAGVAQPQPPRSTHPDSYGSRNHVALERQPSAAPPLARAPRRQRPVQHHTQHLQQQPSHAMDATRLARFDAALRAGHLDGAIDVVAEAAAASSGAAAPLLERGRNRALIQACFARGRPDRALAYARLVHPRAAPWVSVLREAAKRRDAATVQRLLAAREAAGLPLDSRCAASAIAGLSGGGRLGDALALFCRAWEARECRTVAVANAAISAAADQANWDAAQEVVAIMEREGVAPDIVTYNSRLKAAAACALLPEARALHGELLAARLRPNTFTYAALFTAAARAHAGDAGWLLQLWDEMLGFGVEPNDYVASALFSAASHAACTPAQLDALFAALALLRGLGPPNDTVYSALLALVQRQALSERAADVWTAARQDGVRLSPHLFSALFAACAPGGSPALQRTALEAAEEMRGAWRAACARGAPRPHYERDMLVAHNALLHLLGRMGEVPRALALYRRMRAGGPAPDAVTFNTLIAAAASRGDVRVAMGAFSDMVDADIEPTERTAGALLNCYAKARDPASARRVFQGMAALGIRPNLEIYTSLVDACVQAGGPEWTQLAFELADEMRREGLTPSAVTYGCLLAACERAGDVSRAFQLYQQACDEGVRPSDQMHDMLLSMCTEAQRLEEAVDLVKRLARAPGAGGAASGLREHSLNSLIRALCGKYVDRALRMLSLCQAMGMRPTRDTYLSLVAGCARASRSAAAYDLYRSMRSQGMEADSGAGSALIVSLCRANQLEVAETVYNDMLACAWRREAAALPADLPRRSGLSLANRGRLPDGDALAALVAAFAGAKQMRGAAKYYKQLRRLGAPGLAGAAVGQRRMWEALIENYCRLGQVGRALQVFDDWKAARDDWLAARQQHRPNADDGDERGGAEPAAAGGPPPPAPGTSPDGTRFPKLSTVSLAFLEACCRSEPEHRWRVYDVCAAMRQQKELKRQAGLARPRKASHHFAPA